MSDINEYIDEINSEFKETLGGSFVRLDTGEIFTLTEVQKYVQIKLEKFTKKNFEEIKRKTFDYLGVVPDQLIINRKKKEKTINNKGRYDGGEFNIVYRNNFEEVINMKLEVNEKLVYYVLRDFVSYPTNSVMINDKIPKFDELEPIIGLKERTIRKALKSLEEKGLVRLVQSGHRKSIYINPTYYASGKDLNIDTLQLFSLVSCDNRKVESYIEP